MKYIHHNVDEICKYISDLHLRIEVVHYDGQSPSHLATASAVEDLLKVSETLWGTTAPYYLNIAESSNDDGLALDKAVLRVESGYSLKKFLLIAYQDGGLISISSDKLPFQEQRADWWRP